MAQQTEIALAVHEFIVDNFLFGAGALDDAASLMGEGIIDSTGVLELVMFVEEKFDFTVADDEVLPENFDSVSNLAAYVDGKLAVGSAR